MFSLAKSVVGLALNDFGISKCRPLYFPVMILTFHFSLFTSSSSSDDERHDVIRHALDLCGGGLLEVGYGVDGVGLLQVAFQFLKQLLLLGEVAHDMHLVVLGVEA